MERTTLTDLSFFPQHAIIQDLLIFDASLSVLASTNPSPPSVRSSGPQSTLSVFLIQIAFYSPARGAHHEIPELGRSYLSREIQSPSTRVQDTVPGDKGPWSVFNHRKTADDSFLTSDRAPPEPPVCQHWAFSLLFERWQAAIASTYCHQLHW